MFRFYVIKCERSGVYLFDNSFLDITLRKEDVWCTTSLSKAEQRLEEINEGLLEPTFVIEIFESEDG